MKLQLTEPPRMTAVDKKTGKEFPICRYECGHLDKNKDGVRYVLENAHNGYPAVREPHEVEVFIDLPGIDGKIINGPVNVTVNSSFLDCYPNIRDYLNTIQEQYRIEIRRLLDVIDRLNKRITNLADQRKD